VHFNFLVAAAVLIIFVLIVVIFDVIIILLHVLFLIVYRRDYRHLFCFTLPSLSILAAVCYSQDSVFGAVAFASSFNIEGSSGGIRFFLRVDVGCFKKGDSQLLSSNIYL
jgi:hypothetical protein